MATSIKISQLNVYPTALSSSDYFPIVQSASVTTYEASVQALGNWMSLNGSSSYALSSSHAITSSYAISASNAQTSSYALQSLSASYALSASNALSSSFAITASIAISASNALSSSFAITASNAITASIAISASNAISASYALSASNAISASKAISASYALSSSNAVTSSYALSSSNAVTSSYALTASAIVGGSSGIHFLDIPVIVAASSTLTSSWTSIIRNDVIPLPNMTTVPPTNGVGATAVVASTSTQAGASLFNSFVSSSIPSSATGVILDAALRTTWPDNTTESPVCIMIRKNTSANWMPLCSCNGADPGNAGQASFNQGMFPINPDGTFYWIKTPSGPNGGVYGYFIRIIGYVI